MHRKEDKAEVVFCNSEATEEPIGNQRVGQEASAKSIQENRAVSLARIFLFSRVIPAFIFADAGGLLTSTAGERNPYRVATIRQSPE